MHDSRADGEETGAPAADVYKTHSSNMFDVLVDLKEIEALKKAQAQATTMFKQQLQDTDSELEKETLARAAGDDKLQKQIDELKQAVADEAKAGQADMDKLKDWVKGQLEPLEESLNDTTNQLADALKELEKRKADVDRLTKTF